MTADRPARSVHHESPVLGAWVLVAFTGAHVVTGNGVTGKRKQFLTACPLNSQCPDCS